jgi:hypothetical protein
MGMTSWLLRHTRPSPLVVTAPGGTAARLAVERYARERGWRLALNPAEANMLVVAGGGLEPYATRVWQTVPAPRVRVDVVADVPAELTAALAALHDASEQRRQATRAHPAMGQDDHAGHPHDEHAEHADHPGMPAAGHAEHDETAGRGDEPAHDHHSHHDDHSAHGQPAVAHAGHMSHGGHDHHMAGMELPGGVPMADRAPDRDGLKLDQLHVSLGPALPLWPPGLIVHTRLQGDVIQDATVERLDGPQDSFWSAHPVAHCLDASARLLALAGWADAATTAQRLRDQALDGAVPKEPLRRWADGVRRSRTLRRLLPDDVLDRLHGWLDRHEPQWTVDALPEVLAGTELATARLIVASHHG